MFASKEIFEHLAKLNIFFWLKKNKYRLLFWDN